MNMEQKRRQQKRSVYQMTVQEIDELIEQDKKHQPAQDVYVNSLQNASKEIALNSDEGYLYFRRGMAKYKLNLLVSAIEDFDKVLQLDPEYAQAYRYRAFIRRQLGDVQGAKMDLWKFKSLNIS